MSPKSNASKGPPPLPTPALPEVPFAGALGDVDDAEQAFFTEGVDGHAESLPGESDAVTIALPPIGDHASTHDEEVDAVTGEDPARTRRRRIARFGVGWGAALLLGALGVSAFTRPDDRLPSLVALTASHASSEAAAASSSSKVVSATPLQVSSSPKDVLAETPSPVRPTMASATAPGATHARGGGAKKGATPSRGGKPPSSKASTAHVTSKAKAPARGATSKAPSGKTAAKTKT